MALVALSICCSVFVELKCFLIIELLGDAFQVWHVFVCGLQLVIECVSMGSNLALFQFHVWFLLVAMLLMCVTLSGLCFDVAVDVVLLLFTFVLVRYRC